MEPSEPKPENEADKELLELPSPRRPWRRATLITLGLGATLSLWLAVSVIPDVRYSLGGGEPVALGDLARKPLGPEFANHWVQGEGELSVTNAIRYKRPLEHDSYRLASLVENPRIWVQVRVPENEENSRFVPPASFVGRLLPMSALGLRQRGLREAVGEAGLEGPKDDAWLLLDGESPSGLRWAIGLLLLLVAFAAFNVLGLFRLGRAITTAPERAP